MKRILFISPVRFEDLRQRHQGLAIELSKNNYEIYYINPLRSNGFYCKIIDSNYNNLKIVETKIPFKSVSHPFIQNIAVKLAFKLLKKKIHLNNDNSILWLAEPSCAEITNYNWARIVYDCCDLHGAFPNQNKKVWQHYESLITSKADQITISHPYLKEHLDKNIKTKCLLVPNASFFETENNHVPSSENKKIKLLSSGAHYEWVDLDWLEMLACLNDVELHIAGKGRGENFLHLISKNNVIFHGELDSNQLFQLMRKCDVGLIPFKNIDLIKGVDPVKAYDYAAIGLKIWAPDIESLHSNKYISSFITDTESAYKAIKGIKTDSCEKKHFQLVPTWSDRIQEILYHIQI